MGSYTACILIGEPCSYHDGIIPSHYMFLWENSRPSWTLVNQNVSYEMDITKNQIRWIPSKPEHILEDCLLMIAFHVIKSPEIISLMKKYFNQDDMKKIDLSSNFPAKAREELISSCRKITNWPKMVITGMFNSSINNQISVFEYYTLEKEICISDRK